MGKTSNSVKQAWNAAHYTQVKVSIDPNVAAGFKKSCISADVSMASVLSEFMSEYSSVKQQPKNKVKTFSTRAIRRKDTKKIIELLEKLKSEEETYADNIPENLRNSSRFEAAERSIESLTEAIDILSEAY